MKHGKKELDFASPEQVFDMVRLLQRGMLKMPKISANQILQSDASQKSFIRDIMSKYKKTDGGIKIPHPMTETLIVYYQIVYGKDISFIRDMVFPIKDGLPAVMLTLPEMSEDEVFDGPVKYFGVDLLFARIYTLYTSGWSITDR